MENDEQTRSNQQRREEDRDPEFKRINNLTTVLRYPDVSNEMTGPLFIYCHEVSSIDLWLRFVPPEPLQKFCDDDKVKNPDVWKYPSNKNKSGTTTHLQINGGKFNARLLYGYLMQQIRILGQPN